MRVDARARALVAMRAGLVGAMIAGLATVVRAQGTEGGHSPTASDARAIALQGIDLQTRLKDVTVVDRPGGLTVTVETDRGSAQISPEEYVRAIQDAQQRQRERGALYVLFNITKPWGVVWVCVGFLGQALFTLRMILQWLASEKHKRSVVPLGFWWGSLFGGMLLLVYFVWRKDIVGIVGQSTGVFIYARNLVLIYRARRTAAEAAHGSSGPTGIGATPGAAT